MKKLEPWIEKAHDPMSDHMTITLYIPRAWVVVTKNPRRDIAKWMIRMAWRVLREGSLDR